MTARLSLDLIQRMSPLAQAKTWARLEDELLLNLDTLDGVLRESEPLRVATAARLAARGILHAILTTTASGVSVRCSRVFPLRKAA